METGLTPDYEIYSGGTFFDDFLKDTAPTSLSKDLILLSGDTIAELPSFTIRSDCAIQPHPITNLTWGVTGVVEGKVMSCAGYSQGDWDSVPFCYTLEDGKWKVQPSMKTRRYWAAASVTGQGLIVSGGHSGSGYLNSTEIFTDGQWTDGPDLPVTMADHCQVTSSKDGVIVAGKLSFLSFQVYKLAGGNFTKVVEKDWMDRYGPTCEMIGKKLVVIGGDNFRKSVDVLDLNSLKWSKGPDLPVIMRYDLSTVYQGNLYIIQTKIGVVYSIPIDQVLRETGVWKKVNTLPKLPERQVFPPPIINEDILKCKK